MRFPKIWEPEEAIGSAWDNLARNSGGEPCYAESKVSFDEVKVSTGIIFRALSGKSSVEIIGIARTSTKNRVSRRSRIVRKFEHITHAHFDGRQFRLPASIGIFEDKALAQGLYHWLAALAAFIDIPDDLPADPFMRDIFQTRCFSAAEKLLLQQCPGLADIRRRIGEALLSQRPQVSLPYQEQELERALREMLASPGLDISCITSTRIFDERSELSVAAASGYKPIRPVALWPILYTPGKSDTNQSAVDDEISNSDRLNESDQSLKVSRKSADQAERKDSFILHRFESILSMIDFLNINRNVNDDNDTNIKKAIEDIQETTFVKSSHAPKTKTKFHLDLAPQDVDTSILIGDYLYPEWNWKTRSYLPDYVHVEERLAGEALTASFDKIATHRQIERVKRQFEVLRPRRSLLKRQPDGHDLDIDEAIRARCDLLASGEASDRLYCDTRHNERDLAVSVVFDASRSTEAFIGDSSVIDIGKQVLVALAEGITICGDEVSIHAFSSLKRERVIVKLVKSFDENSSQVIQRRIMTLAPSYYTRMGAAIRHVASYLAKRTASRRLLLLITDGRPNDLDHYEGRYGVEDTRQAVREARQLGHTVFGITIDAKAHQYVPYIFGPSGFAIIPDVRRLIGSLPLIYNHLTA